MYKMYLQMINYSSFESHEDVSQERLKECVTVIISIFPSISNNKNKKKNS